MKKNYAPLICLLVASGAIFCAQLHHIKPVPPSMHGRDAKFAFPRKWANPDITPSSPPKLMGKQMGK